MRVFVRTFFLSKDYEHIAIVIKLYQKRWPERILKKIEFSFLNFLEKKIFFHEGLKNWKFFRKYERKIIQKLKCQLATN